MGKVKNNKLDSGETGQPEQNERNTAPGADTVDLAVNTLTGDIRDFLLDRLRHHHDARPWNERKEDEQRETIAAATDAARTMVSEAVRLISADGRKVIVGTVAQVTVKDGIKALVELSRFDAMRHELMDAQGTSVLLVVSDASAFEGMRAEVKPTPDQGDIEHSMAVHSEADHAELQGAL